MATVQAETSPEGPEPAVQAPQLCLCGRPHPCPLHGAWVANPQLALPLQEG